MPLIKLFFLLGLMVVLIMRKLKVGYVLLIATVFTEILFYIPIDKFLKSVILSTFEKKTITIIVIVFAILSLSNFMDKKKILASLIDGLKAIIKNKKILAASLPAFIGLLPMPGGALFSAPMTGEAIKEENLLPEEKTYINYWFRHIWEYIFPLYPGIILTSALFNVSEKSLFITHLPFTIGMLVIGYFVIFYKRKFKEVKQVTNLKESLVNIAKGIFPVALIIALAIGFNINVAVAIVITLFISFILYRVNFKEAFTFIGSSFKWDMLIMVIGIFYFKKSIEITGAISLLPSVFPQSHSITLLLLFFLPFITGILTGITLAYVGITFPILSAYIVSNGQINMSYEMIAYISGFLGVLLSPVHLCLLLTNEYFKSDLKVVYRYLIKSGIALIILLIIVYLIRTNF